MWRSSDILIVHLKRFGVDEANMRCCLDTFVDVPLGEFDFSPYFAPDSPFRTQTNKYRLYAIANHTGGCAFVFSDLFFVSCDHFISLIPCSAEEGHYYAYCRPNDGEQWVEFNDSVVREVTPQTVFSLLALLVHKYKY